MSILYNILNHRFRFKEGAFFVYKNNNIYTKLCIYIMKKKEG